MPKYEVDLNGQKFEIEAPDDQAMTLAVKQLQSQQGKGASPESAGAKQLDDYYSSGIYSGSMNPLGPLARSVDAFATAAQKAPLFGWGDEVAAGVMPGEYQENRASINSRGEALRESNPVASVAGEIGGSALTVSRLARLGILPSGSLAPGASLATRVGVGLGEGTALGALYGAGSGEGAEGRLNDAAVSAGTGAVLGGAIPLLARGASSAYRAVADRMAGNQAARDAGVSPEVARMLSDTLEADGSLGPQGLANMQRAGNEAMLADAGPNARSVLDTAIQRGGRGSVNARSAIDARVARGAADINAALDSSLGQPQGVTSARDAIRTGTAGARNAAYEAAYSTPIDYASQTGQTLEGLIRNRVPGPVIAQANRIMQLEGAQSQQILARIGDDGSVVFERLPDVRQIDYITRALNQAAESGEGAGALGGQTTIGRAYQGLAREIRGTLRNAVPEYAQALDTAADPIRRSQAVDFGSKLLSPSVTRDQVAHEVAGASVAEREALAQGIRSRIDDTIANVTRTVADGDTTAREGIKALKEMSSRANRQKIAEAIGQQRAQPLFDELDRVATSFELRASVAENSRTFARQSVSGRIDDITAPGAVGTALQGKPLNAVQKVAQVLTGQTPERVVGRQNAIYSEIADFLTRPANQAIPAFQAMQNYGGQTLANQVRAQAISRILSEGRSAAYPAGALLGKESQR